MQAMENNLIMPAGIYFNVSNQDFYHLNHERGSMHSTEKFFLEEYKSNRDLPTAKTSNENALTGTKYFTPAVKLIEGKFEKQVKIKIFLPVGSENMLISLILFLHNKSLFGQWSNSK